MMMIMLLMVTMTTVMMRLVLSVHHVEGLVEINLGLFIHQISNPGTCETFDTPALAGICPLVEVEAQTHF